MSVYKNLINETDKLPKSEMIIANLLIEYIGYECFKEAVKRVNPKYISCIIQINIEDSWVSYSPYLHVFDDLNRVHHQIEKDTLINVMREIGYHDIKVLEKMLPDRKKLLQIDFER